MSLLRVLLGKTTSKGRLNNQKTNMINIFIVVIGGVASGVCVIKLLLENEAENTRGIILWGFLGVISTLLLLGLINLIS